MICKKACKQADYQANNRLKSNRIIQIADDGYSADNSNTTGLTAKDKVVVLNKMASVAMKMFGCRIVQVKNNHVSCHKGFDSTMSGNAKQQFSIWDEGKDKVCRNRRFDRAL